MRKGVLLVSTLALSTAGFVLASCGSSDSSMGHDMSNMGAATAGSMPSMMASAMPMGEAGMSGEQGDIMFAQMMIPHHVQAVEMADIALAKQGVSPFVTDIAQKIKDGQQPEIDQMSAWLQEWGAKSEAAEGTDHMGHGAMTGMMSTTQMDDLNKAEGAEFDRMWLEMMIEHHEGATTMAESVLTTTTNPQVSSLAEAIVAAQRKEISEMQSQLRQ